MKPSVTFDEDLVTSHRENGSIEMVAWKELTAVDIVTTDAGPYECDVYFVLHGHGRGCVVAHEAAGCTELLEQLQKLPGFDNQAVIEAMGCATNARFQIWCKDNAEAPTST